MSHIHAGKFTGFMPKMVKGGIDFISGSGATIDFLVEQAVKRGLPFGSFMTVGNSAQTGVTDLLTLFDQEFGEQGASIKLLYLEKMTKPQEFLASARSLVKKGCTLAGIKAGTTQAGSRAAASHTGAMTTNDTAVQALFDKAGIIRVQSRLELVDVASVLLAAKGRLDGKRVCIVTNAGGPGVMLADELARQGFELPALRASTQARLAEVLPAGAALSNPIDCLPSHTGDMISQVFEILASQESANLDYIAFITGNSGLVDNWEILKVVARAMDSCPIPVLPSLCAAIGSRQALEKFRRAGKFYFEDEVALARALGRVVNRPRPSEPVTGLPGYDRERIAACLEGQGGSLPAGTARQVLEAAGLRFPGQVETSRKADLDSIPFPFPWAMKVMGPLHKTDRGGVRLGIQSLAEARSAWDDLMRIEGAGGCLLQPMVAGSEVLIGAQREADFGHLVAFGLGGIYTETLKDVSFSLAPLSPAEASRMIRSLRSFPLLEGVRGQPGMDLDLLADWLLRIGLLVADFPVIQEMDLNPVKGFGRQLFVVDSRIVLE